MSVAALHSAPPAEALACLTPLLRGDRDPVVLCTPDGVVHYANPAAARWRLDAELTEVLTTACRSPSQAVACRRGEVVAERLPSPEGLFLVRLHPEVLATHPLDLIHKLQQLTSERRMPMEQRLAALLRLGVEHFGMDRAVHTRVDGRFRVIERLYDPTSFLSVDDEHPLKQTWCRHTMRANGAFGVHDIPRSEHRDERCAQRFPYGAYLGAPVFVDAVRMGTLALTSDAPRQRFTDSDLALIGLLAQWVGQELARQQDGERYEAVQEELTRVARTDVLTGLPNRRALLEALHWQVAYARRARHSLSVVLCDLDHFKDVNDRFGHEGGDRALKAFAEVCRQVKRETDLAGRWGGEEFLLVLPDTGVDGARVFCERLLEAVRGLRVQMPCGTVAELRVSLGAARLWATETEEAAISRADAALYAAKARGRDQVVVDEGATPVALPRTEGPS